MAVKFNTGNTSVVIPTVDYNNVPYIPLPKPVQSNNSYDPKANYAKALGFLPIDTRYLSNTTNNLAYNSMADVLLNKEAWNKRWGNQSWLNTWYGYLPRVVADTALLIKDTTVDPVMQGAIEDGFTGVLRGAATAGMNTLINIGNTLDILSNPIKGLVLEGSRGFEKGLFGDSDGRKQYDYNEYIHTGNGLADVVLSLGAEILSDPLNWISFGSKQLVKSGSDAIADTATKTLKIALDDIVDANLKNIDDIATELTKQVSWLSEDTAKSLIKTVADESDNITKEAIDNVTDTIRQGLTSSLRQVGFKGGSADELTKLADSLAQSKVSRMKAGVFNKVSLNPTEQMAISNFLNNGVKLPNLFNSIAFNLGSKAISFSDTAQKALLHTAGLQGFDAVIGTKKIIDKVSDLIKNAHAEHSTTIIKNITDLADDMRIDVGALDLKNYPNLNVVDFKSIVPEQHNQIIKALNDIKDDFNGKVLEAYENKTLTKQSYETLREEAYQAINDTISTITGAEGFKNIDEYIAHVQKLYNLTKTESDALSAIVDRLTDFKNLFVKAIDSDDFSDIKEALKWFKTAVNDVFTETQRGNIATKGTEALRYSDKIKAIRTASNDFIDDVTEQASRIAARDVQIIEGIEYITKQDEVLDNYMPLVKNIFESKTTIPENYTAFINHYNDYKNTLTEVYDMQHEAGTVTNLLSKQQDAIKLYNVVMEDLNTTVLPELRRASYLLVDSTAKEQNQMFRTFIKNLQNITVDNVDDFVNLQDYVSGSLISYTLMTNQTRFINDMLGMSLLGKSTGKTTPLSALLMAYKNEDSTLYKFLSNSTVKPNTFQAQQITKVRNLFNKLNAYQQTVDDIVKLCDAVHLDIGHRQGLIDALVTEVNSGKALTSTTIKSVADRMMQRADTYFKNHIISDSYAMDNVLRNTALEIYNKLPTDSEGRAIAQRIIQALDNAHDGTVDVDNWLDLLKITEYSDNPVLQKMSQRFKNITKNKHTVVFDIETTGVKGLAATPFQIAGKVIDDTGAVVESFNYYIKPKQGVRPLDSVLRKLAPSNITDVDALHKWWSDFWSDDNVANLNGTLFQTPEEAVREFENICKQYGSDLVFAGQNIKTFDINILSKYANPSMKTVFKNTKVFDSLEYMITHSVFQMTDETRRLFTAQLQDVLINAFNKTTLFNGHSLLTGSDVRALWILPDSWKSTVSAVNKLWKTPPDFNPHTYFTTSKLISEIDTTTYTRTMSLFLQNLYAKGLINTIDEPNIMHFLNGNTAFEAVHLNMKTAISYELSDVFAINKIDNNGVVTRSIAESLTDQARAIINIRNVFTEKRIKQFLPDAEEFLDILQNKELLQKYNINISDNFVKWLADDADDATKVATAIYMFNKLEATNPLKNSLFLDQIKVLHTLDIDPTTNLPKFIYETDYYDYYTVAKPLNSQVDPFDNVRNYNVDKNIYNAHTAAAHKLQADNFNLAKRVETYLNAHKKRERLHLEKQIFAYNSYLDEAHIKEVLTRPNRVDAFKAEAKLRAGRFYFETKEAVDLSDFNADDGLIAVSKELFDDSGNSLGFGNIILTTKETYTKADDITRNINIVNNVPDMPKELFELLKENRYANGLYVHNIGWSHGDYITESQIKAFDNMLEKEFGINTDLLVDVQTLKAQDYFSILRANNSVVGGYEVFNRVYKNTDRLFVEDPFKLTFYNTRGAVTAEHTKLAAYANLLFNEYNSLDSEYSPFFGLKDYDLMKLCKKHKTEFGLYYIETPHIKENSFIGRFFSDQTKSGYVLREIPIVNERSIEIARKAGAHVLPRTQAIQLMEAFNTFKLPPIAQFASNISAIYKVGYLGSLGVVIRNFIDSNYKTRWALDGTISIPDELKGLFETMKLIKDYNAVGDLYSSKLGKYFKTDLDYEVFYKFCNNIDDADVLSKIVSEYTGHTMNLVEHKVNELLNTFTDTSVIKDIQGSLIEPNLFSVMDTFIRTGPSAGLSKQILNNISVSTGSGTLTNKFLTWVTDSSPLKYVYGANDMVEQSARLYMFLQELNRGSNIDSAIANIIKTHFDYSDKSLAMLYTEIVFPFMSFSYKNLNNWIESVYRNPQMVGELENIFRPLMNYQSLYEPDQEAYKAFDYSFDWNKSVFSFQANAPWAQINAARLYHLLAGNVVIDTNKTVQHNAGYGTKLNDLYAVFKLSPSFLDAVNMLYSPLDAYSSRILPPYETLVNIFSNMSDSKNLKEQLSLSTLVTNLPYVDAILQRTGLTTDGWKHNNIVQRINDAGPYMALSSVFGAIYVPQKKHMYYYDQKYNILGGLKHNYYAKRNYSNPYDTPKVVSPRYTITRMAQNKKPKPIYIKSARKRMYDQQYNSILHNATDNILKSRVKDYKYYY